MNDRMKKFYMGIAEECANMSRAVRLQVGAVIVKNNNIISFSWNGTPTGWDNCCEYNDYDLSRDINGDCFPDLENQYPYTDEHGRYALKTKLEVIHAESNAISKLARSSESGDGAIMFITHAPCIDCAKLIYQSGIATVYYKHDYRSTQGVQFLNKSNIEVVKV